MNQMHKKRKLSSEVKETAFKKEDRSMTADFSNEVELSKQQTKKCKIEVDAQHEIKELNEAFLNINSLPEEMLTKIFGYLTQNELGQIARVCRRWNVLTRSPVLWKSVDVSFNSSHESQDDATQKIISNLSLCTTRIKLNFMNHQNWTLPLNFQELSLSFQRACPHLEVLVLKYASLTCDFSSVIHLSAKYLPNLRILCFRECVFTNCSIEVNYEGISKIEVLKIQACRHLNKPPFSKMPYLNELHMSYPLGSKTNYWFDDDDDNNSEVLNLKNSWTTYLYCIPN